MNSSPSAVPASPSICAARPADERGLLPPSWVRRLLGREAWTLPVPAPAGVGTSLEVTRGEGFCLASARVREARGLDRAELHAATAGAYRQIEAELRMRQAPHPVRLWNHIPGIHEPMGDGQDRYMIFNAGRYEALSAWFGRETFDTRVATASGVGHEGQDLVIHCLATNRPGQAVDNPRQTKPYRYSRKYGPLPPCFARATVLHPKDGAPLLLVGGTASIVGEDSVHVGELARQVDETLTNLAVLVREAGLPEEDRAAALARYSEVRVYYPDPQRLGALQDLLREAFPHAGRIEWVHADLCRAELWVEIEGVAEGRAVSGS
jgi:chorismate lyase / 3-hydroxybenzoate synthase